MNCLGDFGEFYHLIYNTACSIYNTTKFGEDIDVCQIMKREVLMWCSFLHDSYLVGAFFTRTTLAILFVVIIYLLSYLPYIILVSMETHMEFYQKILAVSSNFLLKIVIEQFLCTGKYLPLFCFCSFCPRQWANLRLDETIFSLLFSFNTTVCGRI